MSFSMSREWSSNGALAVDTGDSENISSDLDNYSNMSCDRKNIAFDWHFPTIDLCEDSQWLFFENESCTSEACYSFKNKLQCEFHTEIFLQRPFIVQKLIKWLNENKETNLILECLNYLVKKLIKRHYEYTNGLYGMFESIDSGSDCNSKIAVMETYSETTSNDEISQWGIAKFCVSLMPTILKHIDCKSDGAFSLFMSSVNLLSSISNSCDIKFYIELVFSSHTVKNMLLNEPLSSLKFLVIVNKLLALYLPNEQFKEVICNVLKKPYWIHLYPELYHQLHVKLIREELLEMQIIKMVENAYALSSCKIDIKQYAQLFNISLPIIWFHKKYNIIDTFIAETCKYAEITETHNDNEYSKILLNLLSFQLSDVVLHTYLALNKTLKKFLNNFNVESKKIDRLIKVLLSTNVLNEIICFGCANSNEQICQLSCEMMGQLLTSKDTIKDNQWKCFLNNLAPVFPILYCYANQLSTFGQIILNLFDPDQAEKFSISKIVLLQSIILMLLSKDNTSRVEANNRITWYLKTSLDKTIDVPSDIFMIEFDDLNEKVEEPIGEYTKRDLDDMIDLISNEHSSHQTIKCALYKISVMLEHKNLQQYFIQNEGINIILNLLKLSKLFVNERGMLMALLKLVLCFTKKNKFIDKHNLLANNFEIQLQLIAVLSDFYKVPLVKQYILQIFFYCIFDRYLTCFGEIPKAVMDKVHTPIKIKKYGNFSNNRDGIIMLYSKIKDNKNCMDVLTLTWNLNHFENIDLFLENGLRNPDDQLFNEVFRNFRKASIKWSIKKLLVDLIAAKSHPVALAIISDLKSYLELTEYIEHFEIDQNLLENGLRKFLVLPPIFLTDLQTLIVVLKLLNFVLNKRMIVNKLNWIADTLTNSISMHHNMMDNFENDENSKQLYNQYFIELYEVYWLCLKNFSQFSTLSLTKLLFDQLAYTKNEFVLLQVNMKCLTLLTENPKNIDTDLVKMYLSQLVSLQTILTNEKSLQRSYLVILNHILHYTILVPNIYDVWCVYDWETWTWSMIHSTDTLVRALVFQFSAGLAIIDIPVSHNLIQLALNYFCESNCLENCVVAEQATIFGSNIFCNPKFKSLCYKYIIKLDFNVFVHIINMCSNCDYTKPGKKSFLTSPKLVGNICCMLFNMITLTELNLHELDQNNQLVHELVMCLKKYLTPVTIEEPNIMEMCGRICSVLTLFIPVSNYNFENLLTSLNVIYKHINTDLDYCTTMVWKSVFKLTTAVIKCSHYNTFIITNNIISALSASVTSKNNDLYIDALNVISVICSQLPKKFAHHLCKILVITLLSEWNQKSKRKMLLITLSNVFVEHPCAYKTARQENLLSFVITKLKIMQLQIAKQSTQKSKTLQNDYLKIVGFCCNLFYGCVQAREDASAELPDLIHKLWPVVVANSKSDMLIYTIQMLTSLTSDCPSACSAMTMTSSTLGVDPKTKSTSYSLFHEIIVMSCDIRLHGDVLNISLPLLANCCQAQECRVAIAKSKLLSNIISVLHLKDKKRSLQIEQQCLEFLLVYTSFNEGQIHVLKVDYVLDTLVGLLNSSYKNDSLAILRNLCFNVTNRIILLSSDVFLSGIKSVLESGNLADKQYRDIGLAVWSVACNNQKARLQLRHWGIDKYFGQSRD